MRKISYCGTTKQFQKTFLSAFWTVRGIRLAQYLLVIDQEMVAMATKCLKFSVSSVPYPNTESSVLYPNYIYKPISTS